MNPNRTSRSPPHSFPRRRLPPSQSHRTVHEIPCHWESRTPKVILETWRAQKSGRNPKTWLDLNRVSWRSKVQMRNRSITYPGEYLELLRCHFLLRFIGVIGAEPIGMPFERLRVVRLLHWNYYNSSGESENSWLQNKKEVRRKFV